MYQPDSDIIWCDNYTSLNYMVYPPPVVDYPNTAAYYAI